MSGEALSVCVGDVSDFTFPLYTLHVVHYQMKGQGFHKATYSTMSCMHYTIASQQLVLPCKIICCFLKTVCTYLNTFSMAISKVMSFRNLTVLIIVWDFSPVACARLPRGINRGQPMYSPSNGRERRVNSITGRMCPQCSMFLLRQWNDLKQPSMIVCRISERELFRITMLSILDGTIPVGDVWN